MAETMQREEQIVASAYAIFCEEIGSGPAGCDACRYCDFNTEEQMNCFEAFKHDVLKGM